MLRTGIRLSIRVDVESFYRLINIVDLRVIIISRDDLVVVAYTAVVASSPMVVCIAFRNIIITNCSWCVSPLDTFKPYRKQTILITILKTNGRHFEILLPVSILTFSLPSACDSALAYQILCKSDDRRQSYDVILILQDGGHSVTNLLPVSGLVTSHMSEGPKLSAYQISTRYLNSRPRYYYFRFLKTNGRHLEILLLV